MHSFAFLLPFLPPLVLLLEDEKHQGANHRIQEEYKEFEVVSLSKILGHKHHDV